MGWTKGTPASSQIITLARMVEDRDAEIERLRDALKKHDAWLGQAHVLCSDLGVPPGHIEDRLFEAIGKVPNASLSGLPLGKD